LLSNEFSLSEYTKIDVGWDFAPDPTEGAHSAPQIAGFKGSALRQKGNGGREGLGEGEEGREGKGGNGEERRGEVGGIAPWLLGNRRPCVPLKNYSHSHSPSVRRTRHYEPKSRNWHENRPSSWLQLKWIKKIYSVINAISITIVKRCSDVTKTLYQYQDQDIRPQDQDQDTKWKSLYLHDRKIGIEKWYGRPTSPKSETGKNSKAVRLSVGYIS